MQTETMVLGEHMLEQVYPEVSQLVKMTQATVGKKCEKEELAQTNSYDLTEISNSIHCPCPGGRR